MITNLKIQNFKSLKDIDLELKSLNILTGLNSSGKSSVIQVLRLLRDNKDNIFEGKLLRFTNNIVYWKAKSGLGIILDFDANKNMNIFSPFPFQISENILRIESTYKYQLDGNKHLLSSGNHNENSREYIKAQLEKISLFNNNFQYLNTERIFFENESYRINSNTLRDKVLGEKGQDTPFYLSVYGLDKQINYECLLHPKAKNNYLLHQVNAWLSEISPDVNVITELGDSNVKIFFEYGNLKVHPKEVGFGLSYILPVIVALLMAEKDRLIIIENPEAHIHPRGQAELGRLLALASQTGAQIIIETHSDHILNGVRVAVSENAEMQNNVRIFFHDKITENEEQYSKITPIKIDKNGELSQYPNNFLDEWTNQLIKLV